MTQVKKVYDYGGGFGGPLKQNKLWFYTSVRWWGSQEWAADKYFNLNEGGPIYAPDLSRPAHSDFYQHEASGRVRWAATDKQTYTFSLHKQRNCNCNLFIDFPDRSYESTVDYTYYGIWLGQATWVYPVTNRLLIQAGATHLHNMTQPNFQPEVTTTAISTRDFARGGIWYNAPPAGNPTCWECGPGEEHNYGQQNQRFAVSYVAGAHNLKVGIQTQQGTQSLGVSGINYNREAPPLNYNFSNGVPLSIIEVAAPAGDQATRMRSLGLYVQDQWVLSKLTLNLGLRYDHFKAWVPEQTRPAGYFTAELHVDEVENAGNFHDLGPRAGRVVRRLRQWQDGDQGIHRTVSRLARCGIREPEQPRLQYGDAGEPDLERREPQLRARLRSPQPIAERGMRGDRQRGVRDRRAGQSTCRRCARGVRQPPIRLGGIGVRAARAGAQRVGRRRLFPHVVREFHRHGQHLATPADYDPFCITLPLDSRLPGGGGNQLCDLGDITPAKFGLVDNVVTQASNFGNQERVFDGVDAKVTARVRGALITGGWNIGRQRLNCVVVDGPVQFCDNRPPFQSDFKLGLSYALPWDIQVATVIQNVSGAPKCFNVGLTGCLIYYAASDAEIFPSLGRHLSACGAVTVGCTAFQLVTLAEPNTLFEDRATQIDLRFSKRFPLGGNVRIQGKADVYNLLNRSAVARQVFVYGPTYGLPTEVMGGRLFKFGAMLEF